MLTLREEVGGKVEFPACECVLKVRVEGNKMVLLCLHDRHIYVGAAYRCIEIHARRILLLGILIYIFLSGQHIAHHCC